MNKKRPTVKEIAHRAGVSIGTVDRVLNSRGEVSATTKAKVESIIDALGYKPDLLARQLSLNKSYHLRVLLPRSDQDSGYWRLCRDGIETAAKDLLTRRTAVSIDEFDRYDRSAFRHILDSIISDPGDGLLVAPALPDELRPVLQRFGPNFPYMFFDGSLEATSPRGSVGQDPLAAGQLAGRMMSLLSPDAEVLVAITAHAEDRHLKQRIEGFKAFYASHASKAAGKVPEILVRGCPNLERREDRELFLSALLDEQPGLGGILVANASGHFVGEWLVSKGLKKGKALVSWDLVPANEEALDSGAMDCVISQRPFEQGRLGLESLFRAVSTGESQSPRIDLPIELWFKENLPAYYRADKDDKGVKA